VLYPQDETASTSISGSRGSDRDLIELLRSEWSYVSMARRTIASRTTAAPGTFPA
jgi:hypothetical protein